LALAVEMTRALRLPLAVVVNRADVGDDRIRHYAERESIPLLLEIPFEREAAEAYARGDLLVEVLSRWKERMLGLNDSIRNHLQGC
jgi:MinD superfamily P-loop ATPase